MLKAAAKHANLHGMTKREAIDLFGGKVKDLAAALGVTSSAVSQMPEVLTPRQENEVIGAAIRLGIYRLEKVA